MRYTKKIVLGIISLSIGLSGCVQLSMDRMIFDDNEKIVREADTYSYITKRGDVIDQKASFEIRGFYGTDTIYQFEQQGELTIHLNVDLTSGRFKVVFIDPQQNITILNSSQTMILNEGTYRIKLVGENAYAKVDMDIIWS